MVAELRVADPQLLDELVDEGVGCRTENGFAADPALLALADHLFTYGVPAVEISRVILTAARAAGAAEPGVRKGLQAPRAQLPDAGPDADRADPVQPDAAITAVALELTTTAFRLALQTRLTAPGR